MQDFYNPLKLSQRWASISKNTVREALLSPEEISAPFVNMMMMMPSQPGVIAPAHIPMLSDLEDMIPVLCILMTWSIEKLQKLQSFITIPWELQSFVDPVPVIPRLRELLNITQSWLEIVYGSATNTLKLASTVKEEKQLFVALKWGKRVNSKGRLCVLKMKANRNSFFCLKSQEWKEGKNPTSEELHPELRKLNPIKKNMKVLAWNARGIARPAL